MDIDALMDSKYTRDYEKYSVAWEAMNHAHCSGFIAFFFSSVVFACIFY